MADMEGTKQEVGDATFFFNKDGGLEKVEAPPGSVVKLPCGGSNGTTLGTADGNGELCFTHPRDIPSGEHGVYLSNRRQEGYLNIR